jgi:hypothetical protein
MIAENSVLVLPTGGRPAPPLAASSRADCRALSIAGADWGSLGAPDLNIQGAGRAKMIRRPDQPSLSRISSNGPG